MEVIKKILSLKIVLFLLLLAVIWMGLVSVKAYYRKHQLDQDIASLKKEVDQLDKSDKDLSQMINYFNNQDYLKQEAKDKLNLQEPGESVVMVPEGQLSLEAAAGQSAVSATGTEVAAQGTETQKNNDSNPMKWLKYLFGR
jgi:cell division protein FtsL